MGQRFLAAVVDLGPAQATPGALRLHMADGSGADRNQAGDYVQRVRAAYAGQGAAAVLDRVESRRALLEVISEATSMLDAPGGIDSARLLAPLDGRRALRVLEPVGESLSELPEPPEGLHVQTLPSLQRRCHGLYGVTVLAGPPEIGKTTLAWQLAIDVGRHTDVLYYSLEMGLGALLYRIRDVAGGDLDKIRKATRRLYFRSSIRTLDQDLTMVKPPALIVVDQLHKLPTSSAEHQQGLAQWMIRFEGLRERGYPSLLISEVGRQHYNSDPSIASFKDTGQIEYSADLGLQMVKSTQDMVELTVIKNRHYPFHGILATLRRKGENCWWEEVPGGGQ